MGATSPQRRCRGAAVARRGAEAAAEEEEAKKKRRLMLFIHNETRSEHEDEARMSTQESHPRLQRESTNSRDQQCIVQPIGKRRKWRRGRKLGRAAGSGRTMESRLPSKLLLLAILACCHEHLYLVPNVANAQEQQRNLPTVIVRGFLVSKTKRNSPLAVRPVFQILSNLDNIQALIFQTKRPLWSLEILASSSGRK